MLLLANFFGRLDNELIRSPVLPLLVVHMGGGPAWVGLVGALAGLLGTVARLPIGTMVDVAGTRRPLLLGGVLFTIMPPAYLLVRGLPQLVVARVLHAFGPSLFSPASMAIAAGDRPRAAGSRVGWVTSSKSLASVFGGALAGWLVDRYGFPGAFWASSGAGLLTFACIAAMGEARHDALSGAHSGAPDGDGGGPAPRALLRHVIRATRDVLREGDLWWRALPGSWCFLVQSSVVIFLPVFGLSLGWPILWLGGLVALHHAALMLLGPLAGRLVDRMGARATMSLGLLAAGLGLAALAVAPGPVTAVAAAVGASCAAAAGGPGSLVAMRSLSRHREGATAGLWSTAMDLGEAMGGIGTGLVASAIGVPATFGVWGGVSLVGAGMLAYNLWQPNR